MPQVWTSPASVASLTAFQHYNLLILPAIGIMDKAQIYVYKMTLSQRLLYWMSSGSVAYIDWKLSRKESTSPLQ